MKRYERLIKSRSLCLLTQYFSTFFYAATAGFEVLSGLLSLVTSPNSA